MGLGCSSGEGRGPRSPPRCAHTGSCCFGGDGWQLGPLQPTPKSSPGLSRGVFPAFPLCQQDLRGQFKALSISRLFSGSFVNQIGDKIAFRERSGLAPAFCGKSSKCTVSALNKAREMSA